MFSAFRVAFSQRRFLPATFFIFRAKATAYSGRKWFNSPSWTLILINALPHGSWVANNCPLIITQTHLCFNRLYQFSHSIVTIYLILSSITVRKRKHFHVQSAACLDMKMFDHGITSSSVAMYVNYFSKSLPNSDIHHRSVSPDAAKLIKDMTNDASTNASTNASKRWEQRCKQEWRHQSLYPYKWPLRTTMQASILQIRFLDIFFNATWPNKN